MIISLSRRTDLAIKALAALAKIDDRVNGETLAEEIDTSTQFLPQVVGPLVKTGWVGSERGPGGGYELKRALEDISLLEVVEAAQGPIEDGRCILRDGPCPGTQSCLVHAAWLSSRDVLMDQLSQVTLAEALDMKTTEV